MSKNTTKNTNTRVKVQDLSKSQSRMTEKDMKKVKGGELPMDQVSMNYAKLELPGTPKRVSTK